MNSGTVPIESLQWQRNSVQPPDPPKAFAWEKSLPESDRIFLEEIIRDKLVCYGYERPLLVSVR